MEKNVYKFLGYKLTHINLNKTQEEVVSEIRIGLKSYNLEKEKLTLQIIVEIDYTSSKNNSFEFISGFMLEDEQVLEGFNNNDEMVIDTCLSILFASVYPFIRECMLSITKDTGNSIVLPVIDCRSISLNNKIILTPNIY